MKAERTWIERLRQKLDLPSDIIPGQLQIVLGHSEISIYAHQGIGTYAEHQVQVRIRGGYVTISGAHLQITRMNSVRLQITGKITGIELEELL